MTPLVQTSWILKTHPRSLLNHQSSFHRFLLTAISRLSSPACAFSTVHSVIISPTCSFMGETQIFSYLSPRLLIVTFKALQSLSSVNYSLCFISIHLVSNLHNQPSCQSKLLAVPISDSCIGIHWDLINLVIKLMLLKNHILREKK